MGVQVAYMQCDQQSLSERVACQAALQVVPTTLSTMPAAPTEVENGQPMQTDLATPRVPATLTGVRRTAIGAGDVTAGDANHQAPPTGREAKDVHNTQEAVATSHALPPRVDQAT